MIFEPLAQAVPRRDLIFLDVSEGLLAVAGQAAAPRAHRREGVLSDTKLMDSLYQDPMNSILKMKDLYRKTMGFYTKPGGTFLKGGPRPRYRSSRSSRPGRGRRRPAAGDWVQRIEIKWRNFPAFFIGVSGRMCVFP